MPACKQFFVSYINNHLKSAKKIAAQSNTRLPTNLQPYIFSRHMPDTNMTLVVHAMVMLVQMLIEIHIMQYCFL